MNFIQRLFTRFVSPGTRAAMEAESREWMIRCPKCGFEQSVWESGGVRYKAYGTSRQYRGCPQCGQGSWHTVYRKKAAAS